MFKFHIPYLNIHIIYKTLGKQSAPRPPPYFSNQFEQDNSPIGLSHRVFFYNLGPVLSVLGDQMRRPFGKQIITVIINANISRTPFRPKLPTNYS